MANLENRIAGQNDADLSPKGLIQAKALSLQAKEHGIDVVYSSPLLRARRTAEIVSQAIGIETIIDFRLTEQHYGTYEGETVTARFLAEKKKFAGKIAAGESMFKVVQRVYGFLDELLEKHGSKTVLAVCHSDVCRAVHSYFHDLTDEEFFRFNLANCELMRYESGA
jgi:probable phosphoglycerate mutase